LTTTPGLQDRIRGPMMAWARSVHNWERWVDQWECALLGRPMVPAQFCFQHKHATGRILNIGCASDPTGFAKRGAVNVDVTAENPTTGEPNAAHVFWDARTPFPAHLGRFDTAILGDILEHMEPGDQAAAIAAAAEVLKPGGRLLITCPFDPREAAEQSPGATGAELYAPGVHAFHGDRVTLEGLRTRCVAAGLTVERDEVLDYNFADGIGVIARKP